MSRLREWLHRLAGTFGGGRPDPDLREELQVHTEIAAEKAPREAGHRIIAQHIGIAQAMEAQRDQRGFAWLSALGRDVRYAVRSLLRDRGSVALAVLALSLGIGATTIIFSVVYSVFIQAFPFADSPRIVQFRLQANGKTIRSVAYPADEFLEYRARNSVFTDVLGGAGGNVLYQWEGVTYYAKIFYFDPHGLPALGVHPVAGRELNEADGVEGAPPTFLISDRLWAWRFKRNPNILGMPFKLNGTVRTLIGVMPPRFLLTGADIFVPTTFTASTTDARVGGTGMDKPWLFTFAHLKPGVTQEQAAANIAAVARTVAEQFPDRYPTKDLKNLQVTVRSLADFFTADSLKEMVWILAGAVLMLLLIACSNVANLLLARATARETELALRASLGASRVRLVLQLLAESFVLAVVGASLGSFLAYAGIEWVRATIPSSALPSEMEIRFSGQALLASVALSMALTLLCGLAPALRAARGDLHGRLLNSSRGAGARRVRSGLQTTLVAVQVTLAIVLLVGAGLMMRTLFALQDVDPGFNPNHMLAAQIEYPQEQRLTRDQRVLFVRRAVDRIRTMPGVVAVSPSVTTPNQVAWVTPLNIPGTTPTGSWRTAIELVGEDYFLATGVPLVSGRVFSPMDLEGARPVAVVNRRFGREFLGEENPIGRMVSFAVVNQVNGQKTPTLFEIVGVVGDTRVSGLQEDPKPEAYLPYTSVDADARTILLRTSVPPLLLAEKLRREIAAVNPDVAITQGRSARDTMVLADMINRATFAAPKFALGLMAAFGAVGLILTAIGVFSVMSYTVSLQTRDIGIRMALGARAGSVMQAIVLKGLVPIAIGVVAGTGAAYGLSRLMANQIYGVTATDPWTFAGVIIILVAVGILACALPARRAIRVDPIVALRSE
jgi:putative ABC transport system permease protein